MEDKKTGSLARAKNIFEELKADNKSAYSLKKKLMIDFLTGKISLNI